MEKQIWKYELQNEGVQELKMPKGADILTVQTQYEKPCLWALVNPDAVEVSRGFMIYGTGHPVPTEPYPHKYIGTYQLSGGALVFHVFEFTIPNPSLPTP